MLNVMAARFHTVKTGNVREARDVRIIEKLSVRSPARIRNSPRIAHPVGPFPGSKFVQGQLGGSSCEVYSCQKTPIWRPARAEQPSGALNHGNFVRIQVD